MSDLSRDTNGEANNRCHLYFEPSCRQGYIWSTKTVLPNLHPNLCAFYLPLALHHEGKEGPLQFSVTLADPRLCHIAWKWGHNVRKDSVYKEINSLKFSDLFMKKGFLILSTFSLCWDYFTQHINAKPLYHAWDVSNRKASQPIE